MELLIPGLILVALMVYASTRIKRSAARAYEIEQIDGEHFTLTKPEGFLHRVDENSEYVFEAYSKEFGSGAAEDVRAATAVVIIGDSGPAEAAEVERSRLSNVDAAETFELAGAPCIVLSGELLREGHAFDVSAKIIEKSSRTLVLRIEVLKELSGDFARKIDEMLMSFNPR